MASISKRGDDRADEIEPAPWDERPIIGVTQGLPWWQAILLAFGLALFAAVVDLQFNDKLTVLFQGAYFVACLAAIGWVQRGSLFTPMVQPPLILAVIVPGIVLFTSDEVEGSGLKDILLGYGLPVINGFPTMAFTTGATVATGFIRMFLQRKPEDDADDEDDVPLRGRPRDEDAPGARGRRGVADDDADDEPSRFPLLDKVRSFLPSRGSEPDDDEPPARGSGPDAEPTRRGREPVEPPARRGAPGEPPRRGAPAAGGPPGPGEPPPRRSAPAGAAPGPGGRPGAERPGADAPGGRPGGGPPGRNPSGPTQRPPRTPPERRPDGPGGPGGGPAGPPPGRRRAPSEPGRRPARGEAPPPPSRGEGAEPPPRRGAPKPPPGGPPPGPPPGGQPPAGNPPPGGPPPGGRPPRRRPAPPPDDQPRPPRRQPPPPRRRPWDDQG